MIKSIIPIAFAFDNNLVFPACVCLTSLLANAAPETFYDIYILKPTGGTLDTAEIDRLPAVFGNCKITYREVGRCFDEAYEVRGITTAAYYRLLIPELIPEYNKILYSDVDVIFREDLSHFYNIDLEGYYFAGVDVGVKYRSDIRRYVEDVLCLDPLKGYFYSGNLVINSKKILEDRLIEEFKECAKKKYRFQDMDVINIVCNGFIKELSPEFCLTNYLYKLLLTNEGLLGYTAEDLNTILNKGIIHYNGAKPWKDMCCNQDFWWYYYRKSIVYNEQFTSQYYNDVLNKVDKWSLTKRLRHVMRYFMPKTRSVNGE